MGDGALRMLGVRLDRSGHERRISGLLDHLKRLEVALDDLSARDMAEVLAAAAGAGSGGNLSNAIDYMSRHLYSCPRGHVYIIGDCGGAMQRSTCPECGAGVGGEHHQLLRGNRLATDVVQQLRGAVQGS